MKQIKKILVANRGEVAVRIIRAIREMDLKSAVVYSDADRDSLAVQLADEAYYIGPSPARDSYLKIKNIIEAAHLAGVDAVHPGYGFLAENPVFAEAAAQAMAVMGIAGEIAAEDCPGPGSLQLRFLDTLYRLSKGDIEGRLRTEG